MILVLGGAQIGYGYGLSRRRAMSGQRAAELLDQAQGLGFDALDTAPGYGSSEEMAGKTWRNQVHTKIAPGVAAIESLQSSLKLLDRQAVELAYFHDWGALKSPVGVSRARKMLVPRYAKKLGVSIYDVEDFHRFMDFEELDAVQLPMSILDRRFVDVVWNHSQPSKDVFVRSVLFRGLLGENGRRIENSDLQPQLERLRKIATRLEIPLEELAIRWVCSAPGVSGIVLGIDSIGQMRQTVRMFQNGPLEYSVIEEIREMPQPEPELVDLRRW